MCLVCLHDKFRMTILLLVSTSSRLRLRKIMSSPTSHNFEIPGFAFYPSRKKLTLPSHASNLLLSKGNPYNLNMLVLLEHPQAEQQGIACYTAWRRFNLDRKWRPHPTTNQKLVRQWPNSIYLTLRLWFGLIHDDTGGIVAPFGRFFAVTDTFRLFTGTLYME